MILMVIAKLNVKAVGMMWSIVMKELSPESLKII